MRPIAIAFMSVLVLLCSVQAYGDFYNIQLSGSGGFMLNGADYAGSIDSGMAGTWTLDVDDSLWPDDSDSTARFDYIWNTFFAGNYNDVTGAEHWKGYFNAATLPSSPMTILDTTTPGGVLGMNTSFTVQVRDYYADGLLSQYEKHHACQMVFTYSVEMPLGTGTFEDSCGDGSSSNGSFNFVNPPTEDQLGFPFFGQLNIWFCGAPTESGTWGNIKALYR
jgi:hypothetical protein